jgi:hypothetical protein
MKALERPEQARTTKSTGEISCHDGDRIGQPWKYMRGKTMAKV